MSFAKYLLERSDRQVYRDAMETTTNVEFLWMNRICAEFREMPGMCLTTAQASRLWGLGMWRCHLLLEGLVAKGHLRQTAQGAYVVAADERRH